MSCRSLPPMLRADMSQEQRKGERSCTRRSSVWPRVWRTRRRSPWRSWSRSARAEQRRPTLMFLTKEAVRLAVPGVAVGVACHGCPPLPDLLDRYTKAGGRFLVCPICFDAKHLDNGNLIGNAEI